MAIYASVGLPFSWNKRTLFQKLCHSRDEHTGTHVQNRAERERFWDRKPDGSVVFETRFPLPLLCFFRFNDRPMEFYQVVIALSFLRKHNCLRGKYAKMFLHGNNTFSKQIGQGLNWFRCLPGLEKNIETASSGLTFTCGSGSTLLLMSYFCSHIFFPPNTFCWNRCVQSSKMNLETPAAMCIHLLIKSVSVSCLKGIDSYFDFTTLEWNNVLVQVQWRRTSELQYAGPGGSEMERGLDHYPGADTPLQDQQIRQVFVLFFCRSLSHLWAWNHFRGRFENLWHFNTKKTSF